jgi:hypothetical protein
MSTPAEGSQNAAEECMAAGNWAVNSSQAKRRIQEQTAHPQETTEE